jgi:hypothetical protein
MKIIEIRPSKRFRYHWEAYEGEGVQPTFAGKQDALDYAAGRFGGGAGEVHVFSDDTLTIERSIAIDGRGQYPQVGPGLRESFAANPSLGLCHLS